MCGNEEAAKSMTEQQPRGHKIAVDRLPAQYPTHEHEGAFWESLGRVVATFGFLEEVLSKAIFAVTATRTYEESEIQEAYENWLPKLKRALTDPLGGLIDSYGKAVRDHQEEMITDLPAQLSELHKAREMRNILCHGSWRLPDGAGASVPFFVDRQLAVVETAMDCAFFEQVQRHTAELACSVVSTVTCIGLQFPGSSGPGVPVWEQ